MSESQPQQPAAPFESALMKYTDADAASLGMPTPGALNLLTVFVKQLTGSPLLPRTIFKDMSPQQSSATLLSVVLTGRELGLSPMQSLRAFWMNPDGRLGLYGDSMMAIMRKAGFRFEWVRNDAEACEVIAKRPAGGEGQWESYKSRYSIDDAKAAGLWQKERSVWPKYPGRMCKWRVIGDIFRTLGADLGGGQMYTQEELDDVEIDPAPSNGSGDQHRSDVLKAKEDFKVDVKPKPPAPGPSQPADKPAPAEELYEIHIESQGGQHIPVKGEPLRTMEEAKSRCAEMAAKYSLTHYIVDGRGSVALVFPPPAKSPAPEQPAQASQPAPEPRKREKSPESQALGDRVAAFIKILDPDSKVAAKTMQSRLKAMVGGYHGKSGSNDIGEWNTALDVLDLELKSHPETFTDKATGPEELGRSIRKRYNDLREWCDAKWPGETDAINRSIGMALAAKWGHDAATFGRFIEHNQIDFMPSVADTTAILRLYLKTRDAGHVLRMAKESGKSTDKIIGDIESALGKSLEQASDKEVEAAVTSWRNGARPPAAAAAPKEEPPKPKVESDSVDDLWGDV